MAMLMGNPPLLDELLQVRKERGLDIYDEVWEGVYVMHAVPSDEHQDIVGGLTSALREIIQLKGLGRVRPGINLASQADDWKNDYRCPDVVVFLDDNPASECHDTFWTGGPDLAVEILSPYDETPSKVDFYAKVGTRELLVINRDPWRLELHRHDGQGLPLAATGELDGEAIASESLPITLRLVSSKERPQVLITHNESGREWTA